VERKRNHLSTEIERLEACQRRAVNGSGQIREYEDEENLFDDLDADILGIVISETQPQLTYNFATPAEATDNIFPEKRPLIMPSTFFPKDHPLSKTELRLRKKQGSRFITALREIIADKSFQYTHIIREAPRKAVITRARNTIIKLNLKIAFYCKVYGRCRAALIRLAADEDTLDIYRTITKQDVKASSAIMNPNSPGSTSLSLSWIWQLSAAGERSPANLLECKAKQTAFVNKFILIYFSSTSSLATGTSSTTTMEGGGNIGGV
jgi:hypothetical protein